MGGESLYSVLELPITANAADVRRAFKVQALKYHPDKNPTGAERFKAIAVAYEVLSDPVRKRAYDVEHGFSSSTAHARPPPQARAPQPTYYSSASQPGNQTHKPPTGGERSSAQQRYSSQYSYTYKGQTENVSAGGRQSEGSPTASNAEPTFSYTGIPKRRKQPQDGSAAEQQHADVDAGKPTGTHADDLLARDSDLRAKVCRDTFSHYYQQAMREMQEAEERLQEAIERQQKHDQQARDEQFQRKLRISAYVTPV